MSQNVQVTIYEGKSKEKGLPYKALLVQVGKWSSLHFVNSSFEMEYLEKYLTEPSKAGQTDNGKTILDDDEDSDL